MEVVREQDSECSSGCESGWTTYLDQSDETQCSPIESKGGWGGRDGGEGEDLSMVSDASSGPPTLLHEESSFCYFCCCHHRKENPCPSSKRRRVESGHILLQQDREACDPLDDTASSLLTSFSKKDINATHGNSSYNSYVGGLLRSSYSSSAFHFKESLLKNNMVYTRATSDKSKTWKEQVEKKEKEPVIETVRGIPSSKRST